MRYSLNTAIPSSQMWSSMDIMILAFHYHFYAKKGLGKIKSKQITNLKNLSIENYMIYLHFQKRKRKRNYMIHLEDYRELLSIKTEIHLFQRNNTNILF